MGEGEEGSTEGGKHGEEREGWRKVKRERGSGEGKEEREEGNTEGGNDGGR